MMIGRRLPVYLCPFDYGHNQDCFMNPDYYCQILNHEVSSSGNVRALDLIVEKQKTFFSGKGNCIDCSVISRYFPALIAFANPVLT